MIQPPVRGLRALAPAGVLLAGCLLVGGVRPQQRMPLTQPLGTLIPREVPGLQVADQVVAEEERRVAGMTDYVMRLYGRDSLLAYSTYVGYYDSQTQGKTAHSPRNCLPGAGWEILQPGSMTLRVAGASYSVNRYLLANGRENALVLYWYQGRGRVEANEYVVKWDLLRDAALYGRTDEALVRVIVPVDTRRDGSADPASLAHADQVAREAGERLLAQVARVLPPGPGGAGERVAVVQK
jgi:EpsI family protein